MNKALKKSLIILFTLLCIGLICYGVYAIVNNVSTAPATNKTTTKEDDTNKVDTKILVASLPADDFNLFQMNDRLVLEHKGSSKTFEWIGYFTEKLTTMAYADYNGDGTKELAIVITQDGTNGKTTTQLHILSILENGGNVDYQDTSFSSNTIKRDVEITENFDAVQGENKKRVQFMLGESPFFFQAPSLENGTYYNFLALSLGACSFEIKDGKIISSVELSASFDGLTEEIVPGALKSTIAYSEGQYVYMDNTFEPAKGFAIAPPHTGEIEPYSILAKNNDPKSNTDMALNNITFTIDPANVANRNFDTGVSDERYLTSIEITDSYVRIALADNMKFDSFWIEQSKVLLWMGGEQNGYYIQKNSEITHENGFYYLTTYFDEKVPKNELKPIKYTYGSTTQS